MTDVRMCANAGGDLVSWRCVSGKIEGDGMQLTPLQSMGSGFSAAFLGPIATGPFDVVKVCHPLE